MPFLSKIFGFVCKKEHFEINFFVILNKKTIFALRVLQEGRVCPEEQPTGNRWRPFRKDVVQSTNWVQSC